jgi:hypothetical protein
MNPRDEPDLGACWERRFACADTLSSADPADYLPYCNENLVWISQTIGPNSHAGTCVQHRCIEELLPYNRHDNDVAMRGIKHSVEDQMIACLDLRLRSESDRANSIRIRLTADQDAARSRCDAW